jgi:chromosome segregation protein
MHLKSLTLKGFKSFPDSTRLDFGPGVSVVVGPNGSGKSNVTDAILWAMGEQSPLAVRGQSMQDVIFGGGRGVQARSFAEVEIVLDNSDATIDLPLSEISIVRRLDRSGEGEYRLNGARCRLVDVIEVLSDTGLGKETHSVISQGRVEAIVTSKPRDRRLLIEEAAGLGKHRKRRRRAQLKLERTNENLDRALDVEREARTRLRPLKRQAEAAELHERLEHQMLQVRFELAREAVRTRREELVDAEEGVRAARAAREQIESRLRAVVERRGAAENALTERTERHDALTRRAYETRSARERLQMRGEQAAATATTVSQRASRIEIELAALEELSTAGGEEQGEHAGDDRVRTLEVELTELDSERKQEVEQELAGLELERAQADARVTQLAGELDDARREHEHAEERLEGARNGRIWSMTWDEVRRVILDGVQRALALGDEREREIAVGELADQAELLVKGAVEAALGEVSTVEEVRDAAARALREKERGVAEAEELQRRASWLIEQRQVAPEQGPLAVRRAQLQGELAAERRQTERRLAERAELATRIERLRAQHAADIELSPRAERMAAGLLSTGEAIAGVLAQIEELLNQDRAAGEQVSAELRACAREEAEIQTALSVEGEAVTGAEVAAQRLRDQAAEAEEELRSVSQRLELPLLEIPAPQASKSEQPDSEQPQRAQPVSEQRGSKDLVIESLGEEQELALRARLERLVRRREQLGPVNPLAGQEYAEAVAHVEELEERRTDLETALRELKGVIRETDRQIHETFNETFSAAARNFEELAGDVFPGGSGRLRLVKEEQTQRTVLGGQPAPEDGETGTGAALESTVADEEADEQEDEAEEMLGVEIEITPAGKSTKRLSLLSGGEKSMTALAFMFSVFLARPCPFYVLDEVEAALDDLNLDRFLTLLRRYAGGKGGAQFIVITHQKRTMEAADWLYGVSMSDNGVSRVLSRRLPREEPTPQVAPVA